MSYLQEMWKSTPALRWCAAVILIACGVALAVPTRTPEQTTTAPSGWDRFRRWLPGGSAPTIRDEVKGMARDAFSLTREVVKDAADIAGDLRTEKKPTDPDK